MAPLFLAPPATSSLALSFIKAQFKKKLDIYPSAISVSSITSLPGFMSPSLPEISW